MYDTKKVFIIMKMFLIFLISIHNIHAQDTETSNIHGIAITNMEIECFLNADFNRTFYFVGGISAADKIEFNNRFAIKEGISLSWTENVTNIKLFNNTAYRILADWPIEVKLAWVYNGLPEYETHSHAITPSVSWNAKYYGINIGFGARFTSFFDERPQLEFLLPIGIYVNFKNNEKICVGMSLANYNDFQADSFIAFALAAKTSVNINEHLSIINELEYKHSGADGLTATFHGIVWKGGVKLTW